MTKWVQIMQAAIDCKDTDNFYNFSHLCVVHYGPVFTVFRARFFPSTDCCVPLQLAMLSSLSNKGRYWKFVSLYFKCVRVGQCHWHKINNQKNSSKAQCKTPRNQWFLLVISIVFERSDEFSWNLTHNWDNA